jgi:autotransporter-associated beta strand protein
MPRHTLLRFTACLGAALAAVSARAETVFVNYSNGQNNSNSLTIFPGDTNYFSIATGSATQSGTVSGQSTITKIGPGSLTLAGTADNFQVSAAVSEGTLVLGKTSSSSVHAVGVAVSVSSGATLQLAGTGGDQLFDWVGMTLDGTFDMNGRSETFDGLSGSGLVTNTDSSPGTLTVGANNSSTTFAGVMQNGAGTLALTKSGSGTLTLTGANTYTGATNVTAGGLALLGSGRLSDSTALTVASGATFYLNGITDTIGSLAGAGTVQFGGGTLTAGGTNATTSFSGTLSSSGSGGTLVKSGSGALTLSGTADNLNLSANVNAGTLVLAKASSSSVHAIGTAVSIGSGATLQFAGTGGDQLFDWVGVTLNGTLDMNGRNEAFDGLSGSGTVTNTATGVASTLTVGANNSSTAFGGLIQDGAGTLALVKSGIGTLTLSGTNTYTGGTTISAGTLVMGNNNALGTGSLTIASGATLDIGSLSFDITRFTGAGALTASGAGVLTYASGTNRTFANLIGGSASLDKSGASTLTLTAANTNAGTTTISGGTLALSGVGKLGMGNVYLKNGATLDLGGTTQTVASVGQFDTPVVGTITAGTINTTGYVVLQSGVSNANYTGSGPNARLWINGDANATVTLNGTNDRVYTPDHNQVVIGSPDFTGTVKVGNPNALAAATENVTIFVGILDLNGVSGVRANSIVLRGGDLSSLINDNTASPASFAGTVGLLKNSPRIGGAGDLTLSGVVSYIPFGPGDSGNLGGIYKTGSGTLTLSGNNTYYGATTITAGTLSISSDQNLGNINPISAFDVILNGGTLATTSSFTSSARNIRLEGQGTIDTAAGTTLTWTGIINTLGSAAPLYKAGAGTLVLTATHQYDGPTTISGGTLVVTGSIAESSLITISAGGTLQVGNGGASGTLNNAGLVDNGNLTFNRSDPVAFANAISGSGGVTQAGSGTLTLTGSNTFTGGVTLSAGTLVPGSSGALGSSGAIRFAGGTLQYSAGATTDYSARFSTADGQQYLIDTNGQSVTFASAFTSSGGTLNKLGSGTLTLSGNNTYTGGTTVSLGTLALSGNGKLGGGQLFVGGAASLDLGGTSQSVDSLFSAGNITAGTIQTTGSVVLQKGTYANTFTGSGPNARISIGSTVSATVTLNGTNDMVYTSDHNQVIIGLSVPIGTVRIGNANALAAATENVYVFTGALDLNGVAGVRANSIHLSSGGSSSLINGSTSSGASFSGSVSLDNAATVVGGAGDLALGGVVSGAGGINKIGAGTLTLTASNTYTGATTISAGTLKVNGSLGTSSSVTINTGGTLGGSGTAAGTITINSTGKISPGNSPGTLATGAETWNSGGGYVWELNNASSAGGAKGVTYDWLNISGTLNVTATSGSKFTIYVTSLNAGNAAGATPGFVYGQSYQWILATASGGIANFSADKFLIDTSAFLNDPTNVGGFAIAQVGNNLVLNYTAVPEPSTYALGVVALFGIAVLFRSRGKIRDAH